MKYLSVCSGIEAATVAWHDLGWEPSAFSEIEPFPSAVLKHHYPKIKNLGDMTKFEEWKLEPIDLLVGGTPCQSFSVAGLRKGLDDPRGNLMLTYGAIAKRFRPKWLVWENVPGVLSSNDGRDFATFLGMLAELGYGFAYRVLDAQYFGVAQRRRRVFVVGCLGDWRSAAAVLFERDSLSGNPAPSREARKGTTPSSQPSPKYGGSNAECADTVTSKWAKGSGGPSGNEGGLFVAQPIEVPEVMSTLLSSTAGISRPGNAVTEHETYIPMAFAQNTRDEVRWVNGDGQIVGALAAESGMKQTTYVAQPIPFRKSKRAQTTDDDESWVEDGVANTINLFDQGDVRTTHAVVQAIPIHDKATRHSGGGDSRNDDGAGNGFGVGKDGDPAPTITAGDKHAIAFSSNMSVPDCSEDLSPTLKLGGQGGANPPAVTTNDVAMAVRRLTPVECERLQGFPDNHTAIPWRGKDASQCPDGPRYKALGNSMAVPVMAWIGQRIEMVNELQK